MRAIAIRPRSWHHISAISIHSFVEGEFRSRFQYELAFHLFGDACCLSVIQVDKSERAYPDSNSAMLFYTSGGGVHGPIKGICSPAKGGVLCSDRLDYWSGVRRAALHLAKLTPRWSNCSSPSIRTKLKHHNSTCTKKRWKLAVHDGIIECAFVSSARDMLDL